jgi:hypothetical protein
MGGIFSKLRRNLGIKLKSYGDIHTRRPVVPLVGLHNSVAFLWLENRVRKISVAFLGLDDRVRDISVAFLGLDDRVRDISVAFGQNLIFSSRMRAEWGCFCAKIVAESTLFKSLRLRGLLSRSPLSLSILGGIFSKKHIEHFGG